MFFSSKGLLRWGLLSVAVLGGTTILVGPSRVAGAFDQVRVTVVEAFDGFVDDPVALRRQLQGLADQYPDRIAEVRGEIAEVDGHLRQIEHDTNVANRVIALTSKDLEDIRVAVVEAAAESEAGRKVSVRRGSFRVGIDQARSEARRVVTIRASYEDRLISAKQQTELLDKQRSRLSEILSKLEGEYTSFEEKLWQMDRQIDAIERNDRLIVMTREQQAILSDYEKLGKVGNLRQLEAKLEELRITQEAQLDALDSHGFQESYEQRARDEMTYDEAEVYLVEPDSDLAWLNDN